MRLEHWFYTTPLRLRSLFRRRQVETEVDEELRYHLERKIEEYTAQAWLPRKHGIPLSAPWRPGTAKRRMPRHAAGELRAGGIPPVFIVAALAEIAVSTAKLDSAHTDAELQAPLSVAAHSNTTGPVAEQFLDTFIDRRPFS